MTLLLQTKDVWTKLNKTRFVVFGWTVGCTTLLLGTWMAGCKASVPTADTKIFDLNRLSKAWKKHKDAWRKTVNKDSAPPPVVYLQRDYRLSYDKKGRAHWTIHKVFQPLTKQGVDSTDMIHAYWSPWYEKQPQIEARVRGPKGRRYRLDPKVVEIGSAAARHKILSSRRRLRAPLPGMTPGAIVDLTVRASQHRLVSQGGDVQSIWLTPTVPTLATRITITAPPHLYLKHAIKGLDLKPASDTLQNGRRRVVYRIGPRYKHLINQPHLPPQTLAVPQLVVSTARSWAHAARSARKRLENKIQPAAVQKIVQKLIGGRKLTTRKLVALFSRYIHQKVRYTSVSLGAGAVEPASPQKTLKRTFGDCKDMAVLLTSMLRAAGRKAYPAYIRAGTGLDVWPDMPGVAAFNHVIVWVDGKHPFWTDPTARWTVTDRLPLGCRGRQALVLKPAVRSLIRTPPLKAAENSYIEKRHFTLSERGGGRIVEISRSLSPLFARLRRDAAMRDPTAYKKHMKQYLKNHYAVESVTNIEHSKPTDLDKPFTIKLAGVGTKLALTDNTHAVARLSYLPLLHYLPNYLKRVPKKDSKRWKRKHDLWLRQPYSAHVRYTVDPPVAYALEKHPEQKTINLGPARLTWKTRVDEKTSCVDVDFHFTIRKQRYTARQVKQFWRSLKVLRLEHPELRVVYRHRAKQLIEAGKVRKALDLHRTLIQKYPRRAIHRSRLVEDLVFLGFVRDALKHARRNVRLFPKDIDALHTLAWTLEYNDFGQRWGKGYRRKQAIEAYEKAIAVDPKYVGARADFAKLLLKDENGLPNHDPKAIDAAISHMVVLRNQHNQKKFNTRLLHALLHRKRYTALHRHAKNMKPTAKILGLRVAAVVLAQGLQVGVRLARSWSKNQQTLRTVMLNAFLVLIKHRHYRVAYNLMRPMTEKLGNLQKFEIWSKVKRHAPPQRPPKTVREFLEQFAYRLYSGRWNKQRLNRTLPQSVTPAVRDRFNNMFTSIKHYLERGLKNDVIPLGAIPAR
jgi:transglutaminase-like putative cysteine protease/tetratricopeptide (TPR) repeat protein